MFKEYFKLLTKDLPECRKLFNNCYSVFWEYFLSKIKGREMVAEVEFKNGMRVKLPYSAFLGILHAPNYGIKIDPNKFSIKDNKLYHDSREIIPDNDYTVLLSLYGWNRKNGIWEYNNVKFASKSLNIVVAYTLLETFNLLQYDYFDVKDRDVVDIGAFVGDSAIFFAWKGAKKVYAFEPLPAAYQEMIENIRLNGLEDKIVAFNAAVGSKEGKVKVPANTVDSGFSLSKNGDIEVPIYSLDNIVKMIKDPYLLKMDCEGCEADLIINTESIHHFEKIIFEYHTYLTKISVEKLIEKLNDYECNIKRHPLSSRSEEEQGLVYCSKRKNL